MDANKPVFLIKVVFDLAVHFVLGKSFVYRFIREIFSGNRTVIKGYWQTDGLLVTVQKGASNLAVTIDPYTFVGWSTLWPAQ